jgi:hypothetical protein
VSEGEKRGRERGREKGAKKGKREVFMRKLEELG